MDSCSEGVQRSTQLDGKHFRTSQAKHHTLRNQRNKRQFQTLLRHGHDNRVRRARTHARTSLLGKIGSTGHCDETRERGEQSQLQQMQRVFRADRRRQTHRLLSHILANLRRQRFTQASLEAKHRFLFGNAEFVLCQVDSMAFGRVSTEHFERVDGRVCELFGTRCA